MEESLNQKEPALAPNEGLQRLVGAVVERGNKREGAQSELTALLVSYATGLLSGSSTRKERLAEDLANFLWAQDLHDESADFLRSSGLINQSPRLQELYFDLQQACSEL